MRLIGRRQGTCTAGVAAPTARRGLLWVGAPLRLVGITAAVATAIVSQVGLATGPVPNVVISLPSGGNPLHVIEPVKATYRVRLSKRLMELGSC